MNNEFILYQMKIVQSCRLQLILINILISKNQIEIQMTAFGRQQTLNFIYTSRYNE